MSYYISDTMSISSDPCAPKEGYRRRSRKAENMAIRSAVHVIPFSLQKAENSSMVKSTALLITL